MASEGWSPAREGEALGVVTDSTEADHVPPAPPLPAPEAGICRDCGAPLDDPTADQDEDEEVAEPGGEMSEQGFRLALDPFYKQGFYAGMAEVSGNREMVQEHADRAEEAVKPVVAAFAALRASRDAERARAEGLDRDFADLLQELATLTGEPICKDVPCYGPAGRHIHLEDKRPIAERIDDVWVEVTDAAMKAWDKPMPYNDSPIELIAKIIDERDEAREQQRDALVRERR